MRIVKPEMARRMPWLNGGGETIELAIAPDGATFENLDWRLSAAHVATDGPFSCLADIDRTLVVTSGRGLTLTVPDQRTVTLTQDDEPWEFPGELDVEAALIDGPVDDLNIMTRRGRFRHKMIVRRVSGELVVTNDAGVFIFSCRDCGAYYETADSRGALRAGDFVILEDDGARLLVRPDAETRLCEIRLWPL